MSSIHVPKSAGVILGGTFAILGGLVFVVGVVWLARTGLFVSRARMVTGRVVETELVRNSDGGSIYLPVYNFTDAAGISHTQRSSSGSSGQSFTPGQSVTLFYDAAKPKDSRIGSLGSVWVGPLFVTGFGIVWTGFACIFVFVFTRAIQEVQPRASVDGA